MLKVVGFIFLIISCTNVNTNDKILGNWKRIKTKDGPKFQTEIFINENSLYVFSEEVNDLIFSRPYHIEKNEIVMIEDVVEKNEIRYKFIVSDKNLILSWDSGSIKYLKVLQEKTLEDYLMNLISLDEYVSEFKRRK